MRSKVLLALFFLFLAGVVHAGSDRFGNARREVPRSSYTETSDFNVIIASVPSDGQGGVILRGVIITGAVPSTITFYDTVQFEAATSTRAKFSYLGTGSNFEIQTDMYFSSALMYIKQGLAPALLQWDYTTAPKHGDIRK